MHLLCILYFFVQLQCNVVRLVSAFKKIRKIRAYDYPESQKMQLYESSGAPCTVLNIKLSVLLSRPCFKILGTEQFARIDLQEI